MSNNKKISKPKNIISKSMFVNIIKKMEKQDKFLLDLYNLFNDYSPQNTVDIFIDYSDIINVLEYMFDDVETDYIGKFVLDCCFGTVNTDEFQITSAEELFDLLISNIEKRGLL